MGYKIQKDPLSKPNICFHVDMDSPATLIQYWGIKNVSFDQKQLDFFFQNAINRVLELFDDCNVKATFFLIGNDIKNSDFAKKLVLKIHQKGHEIANHTMTHPLMLSSLSNDLIEKEILHCSELIKSITNYNPKGFRAPGYDISNTTINILEELNFVYDSSTFWSILNPFFNFYHALFSKSAVNSGGFGQATHKLPQIPYFPCEKNPFLNGERRNLVEIPLPRTTFLFPFYSNFHLSVPSSIRNRFTKYRHPQFMVYLLHLIEFIDDTDQIPKDLLRHPNLKKPVSKKLEILRNIINNLTYYYNPIRSDFLIEQGHCLEAKPDP
jgi:peptidoglycan-N-acetylglucosamine deacetylase